MSKCKCCCECCCSKDIGCDIRRGLTCGGFEPEHIGKIDKNMACSLDGQERWNVIINQTFIDSDQIKEVERCSGLKFDYIESSGSEETLHLIFDNYKGAGIKPK